ncbi:MAG: hypothetical protein LBS11_04930 [Oscillospiraceae bacterium]|jgi:hypothetical protein|nr:hypothetical protein [Oscillospiraceae bacterium]
MPPIRIHSATELRAIGNNLSHTGDYQLARDITLDPSWSPISRGDNIILDGDGHRVGPLHAPLFDTLSDATVFELSLDLNISDSLAATGGLARTAARSTLQDISSYGSVGGAGAVGGLVGDMSDCSIERCQQNASVSGCAGTGGFAGSAARCQFIECRNTGSVRACSGAAGGVAGSLTGTGVCQGCVNEGAVTTRGAGGGGVAGLALSGDEGGGAGSIAITDCRNMGEIASGADAGGIVGAALGGGVKIESCVSLAAVASMSARAGGVCGRVDGGAALVNNKSRVKVSASESRAGGIVGGADGAAVIQGSVVDGGYVLAPNYARRVLGSPPPDRASVTLSGNRAASRVRLRDTPGGPGVTVSNEESEAIASGLDGESYDCPDGLEPGAESIDADWDDALREMLRGLMA